MDCKCFIHYNNVSDLDELLITATKASLCKIIQCRNRWASLDGEARSISEKSYGYLSVDQEHIIQGQGSVETLTTRWFYHRKCYQNFTNKRIIELAEKRAAKKDEESSASATEPPRKSQRRREGDDSTSSSRDRTSGVLPKVCIICKKKELFFNDKVSTELRSPSIALFFYVDIKVYIITMISLKIQLCIAIL